MTDRIFCGNHRCMNNRLHLLQLSPPFSGGRGNPVPRSPNEEPIQGGAGLGLERKWWPERKCSCRHRRRRFRSRVAAAAATAATVAATAAAATTA
ncbi:hypothetical protein LEMLEM_LOCUS273 [Lemmus lemmus]